jgi:NhaA family Na+:H+ antiporter
MVAGIGFTMSLFISHLAFGESALIDVAKTAVLSASIVSGIAGWLLFRLTRPCAASGITPGEIR